MQAGVKMLSKEHLPDVRTRLHGDDAHVVLLVRPDEEVHRVVREDPAAVGPVPAHAGREPDLSGTYRRNRRVVVSKWTMHAYLSYQNKFPGAYTQHPPPVMSSALITVEVGSWKRNLSARILASSAGVMPPGFGM